MKLREIFTEALSKQQYKNLKNLSHSFNASRYEDIFKKYPHHGQKAYRIYIPADGVTMQNQPSATQRKIDLFLATHDYEIIDYRANKARQTASHENKKHANQELKIGKLLQKLNPALAQEYTKDNVAKKNARGGNLLICISRHPYDVGSMSTGQTWTSCMDLEDGCNAHYVPAEIENGTIVAYLIREDDKQLKRPLARILIFPFIGEEGDFIFEPSNKVYPDVYKHTGFREQVKKWTEEVNDSKEIKSFMFRLQPGHYGEVNTRVRPRFETCAFISRYVEQITHEKIQAEYLYGTTYGTKTVNTPNFSFSIKGDVKEEKYSVTIGGIHDDDEYDYTLENIPHAKMEEVIGILIMHILYYQRSRDKTISFLNSFEFKNYINIIKTMGIEVDVRTWY